MRAPGQRSASRAVTFPGPQPMSAIRGAVPPGRSVMRASRSRKGRVRWVECRRYCCGSHVGAACIVRTPWGGSKPPASAQGGAGACGPLLPESTAKYLDVKRLHVDRPITLIPMEDEVDRL